MFSFFFSRYMNYQATEETQPIEKTELDDSRDDQHDDERMNSSSSSFKYSFDGKKNMRMVPTVSQSYNKIKAGKEDSLCLTNMNSNNQYLGSKFPNILPKAESFMRSRKLMLLWDVELLPWEFYNCKGNSSDIVMKNVLSNIESSIQTIGKVVERIIFGKKSLTPFDVEDRSIVAIAVEMLTFSWDVTCYGGESGFVVFSRDYCSALGLALTKLRERGSFIAMVGVNFEDELYMERRLLYLADVFIEIIQSGRAYNALIHDDVKQNVIIPHNISKNKESYSDDVIVLCCAINLLIFKSNKKKEGFGLTFALEKNVYQLFVAFVDNDSNSKYYIARGLALSDGLISVGYIESDQLN